MKRFTIRFLGSIISFVGLSSWFNVVSGAVLDGTIYVKDVDCMGGLTVNGRLYKTDEVTVKLYEKDTPWSVAWTNPDYNGSKTVKWKNSEYENFTQLKSISGFEFYTPNKLTNLSSRMKEACVALLDRTQPFPNSSSASYSYEGFRPTCASMAQNVSGDWVYYFYSETTGLLEEGCCSYTCLETSSGADSCDDCPCYYIKGHLIGKTVDGVRGEIYANAPVIQPKIYKYTYLGCRLGYYEEECAEDTTCFTSSRPITGSGITYVWDQPGQDEVGECVLPSILKPTSDYGYTGFYVCQNTSNCDWDLVSAPFIPGECKKCTFSDMVSNSSSFGSVSHSDISHVHTDDNGGIGKESCGISSFTSHIGGGTITYKCSKN